VSLLFAALAIVSLGCGYMAATQPPDAGWRFFSWHPFLMTTGMVGLTGVSAVTKKLGGYTNTKVRRTQIKRLIGAGEKLTDKMPLTSVHLLLLKTGARYHCLDGLDVFLWWSLHHLQKQGKQWETSFHQ
jgi:hypothetical protein